MKWCQCHSNDDENGDNAVQRLKILSSIVERNVSVTPTVFAVHGIYGTLNKE
jgi:hypothetical protein